MRISPERKKVISYLFKKKNEKIEEKICDTSYKNLMNLIAILTNSTTINELSEKQAKALELLLLLL